MSHRQNCVVVPGMTLRRADKTNPTVTMVVLLPYREASQCAGLPESGRIRTTLARAAKPRIRVRSELFTVGRFALVASDARARPWRTLRHKIMASTERGQDHGAPFWPMALRKNPAAALRSRLAVSRKSTLWSALSTVLCKYFHVPLILTYVSSILQLVPAGRLRNRKACLSTVMYFRSDPVFISHLHKVKLPRLVASVLRGPDQSESKAYVRRHCLDSVPLASALQTTAICTGPVIEGTGSCLHNERWGGMEQTSQLNWGGDRQRSAFPGAASQEDPIPVVFDGVLNDLLFPAADRRGLRTRTV